MKLINLCLFIFIVLILFFIKIIFNNKIILNYYLFYLRTLQGLIVNLILKKIIYFFNYREYYFISFFDYNLNYRLLKIIKFLIFFKFILFYFGFLIILILIFFYYY